MSGSKGGLSVLGPTLLVQSDGRGAPRAVPTAEALNKDAAFVAVLVAAPGWSSHCRNLVRALGKLTTAGKGELDVVFASLDHHRRKRAAPHFATMPAAWRALPFAGAGGGTAAALGVNVVPSLVVFDASTGEILSQDAKADVLHYADSSGGDGGGDTTEEKATATGEEGGATVGGLGGLLALWRRAAEAAASGAGAAEGVLASARAAVAAAAAGRVGPARIVATLVGEGFKAVHAHEAVRETGGRSTQAAVMFITSKYGYHPNRCSGG